MRRVAPFFLAAALPACATTRPAQTPRAEHSRAPAQDGRQWCAYITSYGSEEVCGIRVPNAESIGCVRTGEKPHGIALAQGGSCLYVSDEGSNTVSVVDASAMRVVTTIAVRQRPNQIALTPDGGSLGVTNNADHSVSVVDTASNEVTRTLEVGRNPHIVAMNTPRGQALVTTEGDGAVEVFDLDTFERTRQISGHGFPRVLTVAPQGDRAFLTLRWLNGALVLDPEGGQVRARLSVGERTFAEAGKVAHGIAVTHDGEFILLTTQTSGELTSINAHTLAAVGGVRVGAKPRRSGDPVSRDPDRASVCRADPRDHFHTVCRRQRPGVQSRAQSRLSPEGVDCRMGEGALRHHRPAQSARAAGRNQRLHAQAGCRAGRRLVRLQLGGAAELAARRIGRVLLQLPGDGAPAARGCHRRGRP
jgi:YVTN family beta-propeller protein